MSIKTVINHKEYTLLNLSIIPQAYRNSSSACGVLAEVRVVQTNDLANKDSVWAPSEMVCDGVNYAYLVGPAVPEFNKTVDSAIQRSDAIEYFKTTIPVCALLPVHTYGATPKEINTEHACNIKINESALKLRTFHSARFGLFQRTGEMTEPLVEKIIPACTENKESVWVDLALIPRLDEMTNYECHIDWNEGITLNKQIGYAIDGDELKA